MTDKQENAQPELFALVRNGYVAVTGPKDFLKGYSISGDEIFPFEPLGSQEPCVNFVDREAGKVVQVSQFTAKTEGQRKALRSATRASSYPLLCDQIAAILKQLELMTEAGERHGEFQSILDAVAAVKARLP